MRRFENRTVIVTGGARKALVDAAHQTCPYSKAIRGTSTRSTWCEPDQSA
jgi:organic hydroperoxide reductase OsmC/OhrA